MAGRRRIDPIRGARAAVGMLALIGLGALALPFSAAGQVVGDACGLFVSSPPAPDPDALACSAAYHLEWWSECAYAIVTARLRPQSASGQSASGDPWSVTEQMEPWSPDGRFAERFVAECEALRSAATAEGRPLVEPRLRVTPHDPSRCPCSTAEHRAWVEGCLAKIDAIVPGMRRWEVMERFGRDGGISFPGKTRLRHCTCRLLKIDVEFDLAPGTNEESPQDLVRTVSDPYLELLNSG